MALCWLVKVLLDLVEFLFFLGCCFSSFCVWLVCGLVNGSIEFLWVCAHVCQLTLLGLRHWLLILVWLGCPSCSMLKPRSSCVEVAGVSVFFALFSCRGRLGPILRVLQFLVV